MASKFGHPANAGAAADVPEYACRFGAETDKEANGGWQKDSYNPQPEMITPVTQ